MLFDLRRLIILLTTPLLLSSCTPNNQGISQGQQSPSSQSNYHATNLDSFPELTQKQRSAFDALNTLQVSTDDKNRLYSTFAGIDQPYYPPDTGLTISRFEFLTAIEQFVTMHCTNLTTKERYELSTAAVLAQQEYTVLHCTGNSSNIRYENGVPKTGTWVIPNVLGRRDVILVW